MTVSFDSYAFEVYNGLWVDITPDVRNNPHPKWNRGIMSNKQADRVGWPGYLSFALDNSSANSAGLAGYYSPGHVNCWSGWTTGLAVRLSFVYDGATRYKYYGHIIPDGITVTPGIYGSRDVFVTCGDFMWSAAQHEVKGLTFAQNKRLDELVGLVVANMPFTPLATSYATGVETFPTIFDMTTIRTTATSEFIKGAMSEWAYVYVIGDETGGETLVAENRTTRTNATAVGIVSVPSSESGHLLKEDGGAILKEDGGFILLDETQEVDFDGSMTAGLDVGYGRTQCNRVNSTAYPRRVDAAATTVLWKLEKSFQVKSGETITGYRGQYRDPSNPATKVSGISMQAMVSGTDYVATENEDGTGASKTANLTVTPTFGSESVEFVLSATADLWIQTLQVKGKGVYTDTPIQSVQEDTASQDIHGVIPLTLDFRYLADVNKARSYCSYILSREALPRNTIDKCPIWANYSWLHMQAFMQLEPGSKAHFTEAQTGIDGDYFINGYEAELYPGGFVLWTPVLKDDPGYYSFGQWDSGFWDTAIWGT